MQSSLNSAKHSPNLQTLERDYVKQFSLSIQISSRTTSVLKDLVQTSSDSAERPTIVLIEYEGVLSQLLKFWTHMTI